MATQFQFVMRSGPTVGKTFLKCEEISIGTGCRQYHCDQRRRGFTETRQNGITRRNVRNPGSWLHEWDFHQRHTRQLERRS